MEQLKFSLALSQENFSPVFVFSMGEKGDDETNVTAGVGAVEAESSRWWYTTAFVANTLKIRHDVVLSSAERLGSMTSLRRFEMALFLVFLGLPQSLGR